MNAALHISVRELHARTGHYLRKAAGQQRVIVTWNGKPLAELGPVVKQDELPTLRDQKLIPEFKKLRERGRFRPKAGERDITDLISEDRDR